MKRAFSLIFPLRADTVRFQLVLVLLLGVVAYANSFTVPLQYDDVMVLRKNINAPLQIGFDGGTRWVTDLTFSLNRVFHGERVAGYHAVNLAIHLASSLCLFFLVRVSISALRTTFDLTDRGEQFTFLQSFVPFTTAAIFVCHPVQTQAVTYIAQRYTSLATLFYLASMLTYIQARVSRYGAAAWSWGAVALVSAVLAMMSKEIAFTLPVMAAVLEGALFRGQLLKKPAFPAVGAALMLIIPLHMLHKSGIQTFADLPRLFQSLTIEAHKISRWDYFLTQLMVVATYLRLLVLPVDQNLDYDYPIQHTLMAPQVMASLVLHLAVAASAMLLFRRSQRNLNGDRPAAGIALRLATLGIFWFYLALAVESSIIPIRDVICEHRLYLPSAGFFLTASCLAAVLVEHARYRPLVWYAVAGCCLSLTAATVARNRVWGSEIAMWTDVLKKSPDKARAHYHVGFHLAERSQTEKALPYLVRSIELTPEATDFWITLNSVVAGLQTFEGRSDAGLKYHLMVYAVDPRYLIPWQAVSYNNLGLAYEYQGNLWAARAHFERAASADPTLDLAWLNQAVIAIKLRDPARLTAALDRLQELNPDMARQFVPRSGIESQQHGK